jgi:predicted nucleic acid-binding protein
MSAEPAFLDTNVPLYLLSSDKKKAARAEELVAAGGVVSVQVLHEFLAVAQGKLGLEFDEACEVLDAVKATCRVVPLDAAVHERALEIAAATGFHIYAAAICAAALEAGCGVLWSEDLQDGQRVEGLTIRNPF